MQDPCNPPQYHVHVPVHHHPPGQVIGRIRRHGTHRLARRLHEMAGACSAGPPLILGSATFKAAAPAVAFVALTSVASDWVASDEAPQTDGFSEFVAPATGIAGAAGSGNGPGNAQGSLGLSPPRQLPHPHAVAVPEPPTLTLLGLAALGWVGLRIGQRARQRTRPNRQTGDLGAGASPQPSPRSDPRFAPPN